ncbi:hypothetical protein FNO09_10165 [Salmonella enterica subsp. diarizonae]|nr:hypothetical protein [Salmonella enterica]ECF6065028.1 hypothetical protein [Salmonella enterica subsp. diarizonae]EDX0769056.1 hypothetical protein [Salmonella enterica]
MTYSNDNKNAYLKIRMGLRILFLVWHTSCSTIYRSDIFVVFCYYHVFSNNTSDTLNSLFSINSIWRIIIVQMLIKKGALNAYF